MIMSIIPLTPGFVSSFGLDEALAKPMETELLSVSPRRSSGLIERDLDGKKN